MARHITTEHLRAAFEAMAWQGWTFEQAMADTVRSRIVSLRAKHMSAQQYKAERLVRRTPLNHRTDLKRAAAGDRDD